MTIIDPDAIEAIRADRYLSRLDLHDSRWRAITWICALQVLDLASTYTAIHMAGAEEANPMAVWLVDTYLIVVAKLAICALIVWLASRRPATVKTTSAAWFVVGTYSLAVVLNTAHILGAAL